MKPSTRARKMTRSVNEQKIHGTHNPASECECGTIRTPGLSHTKHDTGLTPKRAGAPRCSK